MQISKQKREKTFNFHAQILYRAREPFSSPNGEIQYGVAYTQGRRASMEDTIEAQVSAGLHQGEQVALFGVYDGHGMNKSKDRKVSVAGTELCCVVL